MAVNKPSLYVVSLSLLFLQCALLLSAHTSEAQTTTPSAPVWYEADLTVLAPDENQSDGIKQQSGWVTVTTERPAFFELRSGQVAQLVRRDETHSEPVQVHIAQGRGMFRAQADIRWLDRRQLINNPRSRDVWVMLQSTNTVDIKLRIGDQQALRDRDYWERVELEDSKTIEAKSLESGREGKLSPLQKDETFTYHAERDERVKLDYYADFDNFRGLSNVPVHFQWQIDQGTPSSSIRYANFNFKALNQHQCTLALSFRESMAIDLKRGETLVFRASKAGFLTVDSNHKGDYFFSRNRANLLGAKPSALGLPLLSEKWYPLLRAYNLSVPLNLTDENNKLTTRRGLYPQKNLHPVNWLYSVRGRPIEFQRRTVEQTSQTNTLHFSSQQSRSNLTKMVLGRYHRLDAVQEGLTFSLPPNRVLRELELEVATPHAGSDTVSLWVTVDDLPAEKWLLVPSLQALSGQPSVLSLYLEASLKSTDTEPVSTTGAFAHLKQAAPMVRTNIAYLPIPDSAKKVTINLVKRDSQQGKEHWISLRDFVYRSNLGDVAILNESGSKTLSRLLHAFDLFREQESNFIGLTNVSTRDANSALEDSLQDLETRSFTEQRSLIHWARFFHVVRNARQALESDYMAEPASEQLRRFNDVSASIWRDIQGWLNGPQPSTSVQVLIGLLLHHPDQAVRLRALTLLTQLEEGGLIATNRLEQALLAYLYQDMRQLEKVLPKLMQLWLQQGKYYLIELLPKPPESAAYFDLLSSVVQRRELIELQQHYDNSAFEPEKSKTLYHVARSLYKPDTKAQVLTEEMRLSYLKEFVYWRANQQPVQEYTQHLTLQHRTRPELNQQAFLVGPESTLVIKSNELRRYRIKAAPLLNNDRRAKGINNSSRITIGDNSHSITGVNQSNWFSVATESDSPKVFGNFSTLMFSRNDQEQNQVTIKANQPLVVYLERMDDPAGLLQTHSASLEAVSSGAYNATRPLLTPISAYLSLPRQQHDACGEIEHKTLTQSDFVRPLDIANIKHRVSKSKSNQWVEQYLAEGDTGIIDIQGPSDDIATSAKLIHWAESEAGRRRYPDLRATAFQQVRWRELLDIQHHAGSYQLQFQRPTAISQIELQRIALSSKVRRDYPFKISGQTAQGFTVSSPSEESASLNVAVRKRLFDRTKPVHIWVQIDDKKAKKYDINTGSTRRIILPLKQGSNVIKLWMGPGSMRETAFYDVVLPNNIQAIQTAATRFFSAAPNKGIDLLIRGPQRLKVVVANSAGQTNVTERHLPAGSNKLRFDAKGDFRYFRFFVLQENYQAVPPPIDETQAVVRAQSCYNNVKCLSRNSILDNTKLKKILDFGFNSAVKHSYDVSKNTGFKRLQGTNHLNADHSWIDTKFETIQTIDIPKPTLGLDFRWVDRDSSDEDPDSLDQLNSAFVQLNGWSRQNRADGHQISSFDATLRRFDIANVYRLHGRNDWLKSGNQVPFNYALGGDVWHQSETDLNSSISSGQLYARTRYTVQATPRISLSTRGRVWVRASNAGSAANFSLIDPDVWSQFKEQHQYGIGLAQRAVYRHKLDSETYAEANFLSNENPLSADRIGLSLGWRSYFGQASSDINVSHRQFRNDSDREQAFDRTDVNVSADWLLPFSRQSNFRLSARARFNTDANDVSLWLNIGWFQHAGQQLFDFRPDELRFRRPRDWWLRRSTQTHYLEGNY